DVHRRYAAYALQNRRDSQPIYGAANLVARRIRHDHLHIGKLLDILAAVADGQHRTEDRITMRADDHLAPPRRHLRDDHAVQRDAMTGGGGADVTPGPARRILRRDIEADKANVGLVRDGARTALD